jgi:hypothetical protein
MPRDPVAPAAANLCCTMLQAPAWVMSPPRRRRPRRRQLAARQAAMQCSHLHPLEVAVLCGPSQGGVTHKGSHSSMCGQCGTGYGSS